MVKIKMFVLEFFIIYETVWCLVISQSPRRPIIYLNGKIIAHDKRRTTINYAFASAITQSDDFNKE